MFGSQMFVAPYGILRRPCLHPREGVNRPNQRYAVTSSFYEMYIYLSMRGAEFLNTVCSIT